MPSDERHTHSFCPVQKKPPDLELGGRAWTSLGAGVRLPAAASFPSYQLFRHREVDLTETLLTLHWRRPPIRQIFPAPPKLFYDGGSRGIACQRPSISLPSWHSSKFAPGMKQELKKGKGTGKRQSTKLHRRRTASVASLNKTSCPVGFPKKKTISVSQFEGTIE